MVREGEIPGQGKIIFLGEMDQATTPCSDWASNTISTNKIAIECNRLGFKAISWICFCEGFIFFYFFSK